MTRNYGWKVTWADGATSRGFVWPLTVGAETTSNDNLRPEVGVQDDDGACPSRPGDGLSVGLTPKGCASGGISSPTMLLVSWDDPADELNRGPNKVRVGGPVRVEHVFDWWAGLRAGWGRRADLSHAYLSHAYLSHADLSHAYLSYADLSYADLSHAYLSRAYLSRAYLSRADLSHAYLSHAYLSRADLSRADLSYADLSHANLSYAYLSRAYLSRADLSHADLSHADLSRADLGAWERGPDGLARRKATP